MAVSRQPEIITTETSTGEGLNEDHTTRGETRWRRFHPFKVVRKIFCRRVKRQGTEEIPENSKKSWSTSELQYLPDDENRFQDHIPPYKVGLSVSHDSIFSHDHSPVNMDPDELEQMQTSSLSIPRTEMRGFRDELFTRVRARRDSDDEDVGLPHSPCTSPTTADILSQGLKEKSTKSLNTSSAGSLISMESSENEDDSPGQLSSGHSSRASLLDRSIGTDSDLDSSQSIPLSHEAAFHKISVRPKRTHKLPRHRRLKQLSTQNAGGLPITLEVSEEGRKSPIITTFSSQKEIKSFTEVKEEICEVEDKKFLPPLVSSFLKSPSLLHKDNTLSSSSETKSPFSGVQLMRSRSAAADLKLYQENRQKNYPSLQKKQEKPTKDVAYSACQNKGITVTVNKMETVFTVDGEVITSHGQTTETTITECFEEFKQTEKLNATEKRKSMTDVSKYCSDVKEMDFSSDKTKSILFSGKEKSPTGITDSKVETDRNKIALDVSANYTTEAKMFERKSLTDTETPNAAFISSEKNLVKENKDVLSSYGDVHSQSVGIVTVTQSESSHIIGDTVKLSVTGAYGKTVIHTGGDNWSVNNINNIQYRNEEVKQKDMTVESKDLNAKEEHISSMKALAKEKETTEKNISNEPSRSFPEYTSVENQKTITSQKRFSVEIVPFSQRIKDPNYPYSSPSKLEKRFRNTDKKFSKDSSIETISQDHSIENTNQITYTEEKIQNLSELQELSMEGGKLSCPVHIRIHRGHSMETSTPERFRKTSDQNFQSTSLIQMKDSLQKEVFKDNLHELKSVHLNAFKDKDENKLSVGTEIQSSNIDDKIKLATQQQSIKSDMIGKSSDSYPRDNISTEFNTNVLQVLDSSLTKQSGTETDCETTVMEVNVRESTQIWEKALAGENIYGDIKNKQVSRSSSTTSEEEPELLRVFARRSVKQKTDDRETVTKDEITCSENIHDMKTEILDCKGSNIISTSDHSTIIKISETVATKLSTDKTQSTNIQRSIDSKSPILHKVQKVDTEIKSVINKSVVAEKIFSNEVKQTEVKPAVVQNIFAIENEQKIVKDKKALVKRIPSSGTPKEASDVKPLLQNPSSEFVAKNITLSESFGKSQSDESKCKYVAINRTPSDTSTKPTIDTKPAIHKVSSDAKSKSDISAKVSRVPSIESETELSEKKASLKQNTQFHTPVQKVGCANRPALPEKLKPTEKERQSQLKKQQSEGLAETSVLPTSQRWRGSKVRSHTTSEVSPTDIERAHLRQRKASAPDIPSAFKHIDSCTKENVCTIPFQGNKPELPPKSPSITALAISKNPSLSNVNIESAKLKDISIMPVKNNKEASLPSWLQLAQQRREQREQRERLLMGPTTTTFVLETSGKPTRNSKVWDMVHNFQKLQMT